MVFLASAGNSIYSTRSVGAFLYLLVGMATVICTTILAFVYELKFYFVNTTRSEDDIIPKDFQYYVILSLGIILLFYQVKALLFFFVPQSAFLSTVKLSFFVSLLVPGMAKSEKMTKQAASFKMAKMVTDAVALHEGTLAGSSLRSSKKRMSSANVAAGDTEVSGFGDALLNFHATVDDRESYGGVIWCWKSIWKGTIWSEEGVWIHARLYSMNFSQLFVAILFIIVSYVFLFGFLYVSGEDTFSPTQANTYPPSTSPAPSYSENLRMLQSISPSPSAIDSSNDEKASFLDDLVPEKWAVIVAVTVGGICAVTAALSLFIIWIPSAVASILQFRSGVIGSLRDNDFIRYR